MTNSEDHFKIGIVFRHPSYSPEHISEALSLKPEFSRRVGLPILDTWRAKWTSFHACLQESDDLSDFEDALTNVAAFLEEHAPFWTDFMNGNGEVELILNHTICPQEDEGDKCFELYLAPAFLSQLCTRGIGLRVQGWQGTVQTMQRALPPGPED